MIAMNGWSTLKTIGGGCRTKLVRTKNAPVELIGQINKVIVWQILCTDCYKTVLIRAYTFKDTVPNRNVIMFLLHSREVSLSQPDWKNKGKSGITTALGVLWYAFQEPVQCILKLKLWSVTKLAITF